MLLIYLNKPVLLQYYSWNSESRPALGMVSSEVSFHLQLSYFQGTVTCSEYLPYGRELQGGHSLALNT